MSGMGVGVVDGVAEGAVGGATVGGADVPGESGGTGTAVVVIIPASVGEEEEEDGSGVGVENVGVVAGAVGGDVGGGGAVRVVGMGGAAVTGVAGVVGSAVDGEEAAVVLSTRTSPAVTSPAGGSSVWRVGVGVVRGGGLVEEESKTSSSGSRVGETCVVVGG